MKKTFIISLLFLIITGCTNKQNLMFDYGTSDSKNIQKQDPTIGYLALKQAPLCCNSLSDLNFQQIKQPGKIEFNITDKNQAFTFNTGKSFVKGFTLPKINGDIKITLSTPIIESVFVPTVLVLDEHYEPINVYGKDTFVYDKASVLNVDRYFGQIKLSDTQIKNHQAKYLIILTTEEAMQDTTTLPKPNSSAIELGRAETVYKIETNKPIPHTAIGAVKLSIDYKGGDNAFAQNMVTTHSDESKITIPLIQPETESMYIELIDLAIKNGNLEKAQRFVEEAERAGSNKARDALLDAQKKYTK